MGLILHQNLLNEHIGYLLYLTLLMHIDYFSLRYNVFSINLNLCDFISKFVFL